MKNEMIMNVTPGETRIARFMDGVLSELAIERESDLQVVGNIYKGRITRVLPGMQAAFVDIGLEKAAFLYVADIVPDLFEGIGDDEEELEADGPEVAAPFVPDADADLNEIVDQNDTQGSQETAQDEAVDFEGAESEEVQLAPQEEATKSEQQRGDSRSQNSRGGRQGRHNNSRNAPGNSRGARKPRPRRAPLPKIEDIVREGQEIVVQVAKEPIRTKGARITSHISLPGRYLVYMPTVTHVGVSRRIQSFEERNRLKDILNKHRPASGGFIARTNCIGATEEKLVEDMKSLQEIWQKIFDRQEKSKSPSRLYEDLDIVLRAVRDNFSEEIDRLVIDSKEDFEKVVDYVTRFMPELVSRIQFYDKDTPLFDVYGLENEIHRALSRKVWLPSGGYLIVDSSEALTAIDVNTGKFVGKKSFDDTIVITNLEAVEEIAYQLKLRSIGGIIILDLIDMTRYSDRMKVYNALRNALKKDRLKTTISKISDLGLIEMTRKRTRDSLTQMLSETCVHCHGTGFVKTPTTVAFEVFREVKRVYTSITSRSLLIRVHPRVAKILFNEGRAWLDQLEAKLAKRIVVETDEVFDVDHYEIRGRELAQQQEPRAS